MNKSKYAMIKQIVTIFTCHLRKRIYDFVFPLNIIEFTALPIKAKHIFVEIYLAA